MLKEFCQKYRNLQETEQKLAHIRKRRQKQLIMELMYMCKYIWWYLCDSWILDSSITGVEK